ncbi:hypothetical protein EV681_4517 [Advenella incenata]|uniref:Uncharacterized protein n=1 Tax=Advenella incenata TaxID=267800 RepID=A0A4Q7V5R9_9BURK|nr:hypothetical protein [Advenella incenata]RZT91164.1 hypothetical protein EV681_4517 [Advenella incenata]
MIVLNKILDRLHAVCPGSYRLDEAEVIHLHGQYVLDIDEDSALPTVSLDERMEVGGNVTIADWIVDNEAVLDEIVAAVVDLKNDS